MDYEKAYKEALKRAKSLIDKEGFTEGSYPNRNACEAIFPELAESEDERIRKEIKQFILDTIGEISIDDKENAWLTYLEKQKVNTDGDFARGYDCGYECCLNSHGAEWSEKQKEQKPDYCHHEVDLSDCSKEYRKAYYDGWNNCNQQHSQLQAEQKPAEWSEEDEKIRRNLLSLLANMRGDRITEETYQKYYPWLKSLRPQPHWKPSEEQMDALLNAEGLVRAYNYPENAKILASLYEQLKKLM